MNIFFSTSSLDHLRSSIVVPQQRTTRVSIDLNVRVRGNQTFVAFEDIDGDIVMNGAVEVFEAESGVVGRGDVTEIDLLNRLVYLSVDWSSMAHANEPSLGASVILSEPHPHELWRSEAVYFDVLQGLITNATEYSPKYLVSMALPGAA